MRWMKSITVMLTLLLVQFVMSYSQADQPGSTENWIADEHGCKAYDSHPVPDEAIKWSGKCKDGFLQGPGRLQWYERNTEVIRWDGVLLNGRKQQGTYNSDGEQQYCDISKTERSKLICAFIGKGEARGSGEFRSEKLNGAGVMIDTKNGITYSGNFLAGAPSGAGRYTYSDGHRLEGQIGGVEGIGTLYFQSGSRYYGQLKYGKNQTLEGYGVIYDADGQTAHEGKFSNDKLISKEPALGRLPPEPQHLPYSVQASALAVEIRDALVAEDLVSVLFLIDQYATLPAVSMPPALQFLQAKIAAEVHLPVLAKSAVEKYLTVVNRDDPHYSEAISLLVKVKDAKLTVSP
jgi:hypothetical protein